jgi:hypothetical protein
MMDVCGCREVNNYAHYLSNAFILSGQSELLTSPLITARCYCGGQRAIRAYDMLQWFQKKTRETNGNVFIGLPPRNSGWWATYQETSGNKHVLIIDCDQWVYYGTGDYPDWPVQWNYKF